MTNLTDLWLNPNITDKGICNLTKLTSLNLRYNNIISDKGISKLTNLTFLGLGRSKYSNRLINTLISDETISKLPMLKKLPYQ